MRRAPTANRSAAPKAFNPPHPSALFVLSTTLVRASSRSDTWRAQTHGHCTDSPLISTPGAISSAHGQRNPNKSCDRHTSSPISGPIAGPISSRTKPQPHPRTPPRPSHPHRGHPERTQPQSPPTRRTRANPPRRRRDGLTPLPLEPPHRSPRRTSPRRSDAHPHRTLPPLPRQHPRTHPPRRHGRPQTQTTHTPWHRLPACANQSDAPTKS